MRSLYLSKSSGLYPSLIWNCQITYQYFWYQHTCAGIRKRSKPPIKDIKTCPEGVLFWLYDFLDSSEWSVFIMTFRSTQRQSCTDNVTVGKSTRVNTNQKPWMTSDDEMELSLQVRGQSSIQCSKGRAVESHQGCKRGSQNETGRVVDAL